MPETLGASIIATKNLLHSTSAYVWLFELDLDGVNGFRICAHDQNVTVGGLVYVAFPMTMTTDRRDIDGQLSSFEITISNVGRELVSYLEAGQVLDRTVRMKAVYSGDTATVLDFGRVSVLRVVCGTMSATLSVGSYILTDAKIPSRYWMRGRCPYRYAGSECAFNKTTAAAWSGLAAFKATYTSFDESTCDLTLDGGNGCKKHGLLEAAMGAPAHHPLRYGGNPGIPRGSARV